MQAHWVAFYADGLWLEYERRESDGFGRTGGPREVSSGVEMTVRAEGKETGQLNKSYLANWHQPSLLEMLSAMVRKLTTLSKPLLTHITSEGPGSSMNELMLLIVLLGAEDLQTEMALVLVEVRVTVGSMSAKVVFGSVDTRTAWEWALKAAVVGTC